MTGTVYVPPAIIGGTDAAVIWATNGASAETTIGALGGNQATPSFTSAKRSVYGPGFGGMVTFAFTVLLAAGATFSPSGVRTPSQIIATLPPASYQWYVRFTGFAPVVFQTWLPVFRSVTVIGTTTPAGAEAGAVCT